MRLTNLHKSERLNYITLMQVIATALIVLSHSVASSIAYPDITGTIVAVIQNVGLTVFMWCSGFLMVRTDAIRKYGYKRYIGKRFIRLMIPFFVVQLLMFFPKVLIARAVGQTLDVGLYGIVHSFLYPREGILPHLWFLPTLILLCLISPLLQSISENKVRWMIALVISAALIFCPLDTNILCICDVKNYIFWYLLGIGSAQHLTIEYLKKIPNRIYYVLLIAAFVSWCGLVFFSGNGSRVVSGLLSLLFLLLISLKSEWGEVQSIGRYTFPIYILSLPIQNIVEIFSRELDAVWPIATILMFITGFMLPFLLAYCVDKVKNKCNLKIISRCIGL